MGTYLHSSDPVPVPGTAPVPASMWCGLPPGSSIVAAVAMHVPHASSTLAGDGSRDVRHAHCSSLQGLD